MQSELDSLEKQKGFWQIVRTPSNVRLIVFKFVFVRKKE